jgi:dihydrolipoamide dehydrogenase
MCARATDIVSELTAAIANKQTIRQLNAVVRPHPTFNEAIKSAVSSALTV